MRLLADENLPGAVVAGCESAGMMCAGSRSRCLELETIVSRTGQTGVAVEARGVDKTGFVGALKPRAAVADIPGVVASFSQPIQCRIDELVVGTRAQVIVKLFGDETAVLTQKASEMASVLQGVAGVSDLVVARCHLSPGTGRAAVARW
jgi:cobalt-zinc-cadmium resistance protein CzcA